jgi:hypothetical protein
MPAPDAAPAPQTSAAPEPPPAAAKPPPPPPPPKLVSKESGESGLGLLNGLSADDEDFDLPPIDNPKPAAPQRNTGEKPDASFLKALEDVPEDERKP